MPNDKWTWLINQAWQVAGMEKSARFKLVTPLAEEVKDLVSRSGFSGEEFLKIVAREIGSKGEPHILWQSEDERSSYFAMEIADLLDAGYIFEEVEKKSGHGKKQQFVKR